MKKLVAIITVFVILISVSITLAEETPLVKTNISGSVIDKITGESLAGVKVVLQENNEIVYTDFDGNFEFKEILKGKYTIKTDLISYKGKSVVVDLNNSNKVKISVEN